jgi:hypothetical protein
MAKFVLLDNEQIVERGLVHTAVDGVNRAGRLILTNQRVVLIPDNRPSIWLPRPLAVLFASTTDTISHQIRREQFDAATLTSPNELRISSKGEGYGVTRFDVTTSEAPTWVARFATWTAAK